MQRGWYFPLLEPWELDVFAVQAILHSTNAGDNLSARIGDCTHDFSDNCRGLYLSPKTA
jgi:hypothetical protein